MKPTNWLYTTEVEMKVRVSVEFPMDAVDAGSVAACDDTAVDCALGAVTQFFEREVGRHRGNIAWAKVYAEVSEDDCTVTESAFSPAKGGDA